MTEKKDPQQGPEQKPWTSREIGMSILSGVIVWPLWLAASLGLMHVAEGWGWFPDPWSRWRRPIAGSAAVVILGVGLWLWRWLGVLLMYVFPGRPSRPL